MGIILFLIIGGVAGWLASVIMGTNNRQGTIGDIVLGVVGAIVGGITMSFFGEAGYTGFNLYSMMVAVLGAVLIIWLGRMINSTTAR
jgi:uncharacterized membrane protein YeaQ/YmgE (transglycosylase-associated protein family)